MAKRAHNDYLVGVSEMIDWWGVATPRYRLIDAVQRSDAEAIWCDWAIVGKDIRTAILAGSKNSTNERFSFPKASLDQHRVAGHSG